MAAKVIRRRLPSVMEATAQRFVGAGSPFRVWTETWPSEDTVFVVSAANDGGRSRVRAVLDSNGRILSITRWPSAHPDDAITLPAGDRRCVVAEILPEDCSLGVITAGDTPAGGPTAPTDPRLFPVEALPATEPEPPPPPPTDPRQIPAPAPDQLPLL